MSLRRKHPETKLQQKRRHICGNDSPHNNNNNNNTQSQSQQQPQQQYPVQGQDQM